jgi:hypothetical protein
MNTKTYQKIVVNVPAGAKMTVSERLKNEFKYAVGFFFYDPNNNLGYAGSQFSLKIGGNEIIPAGTDASLFAFTGSFSRNETLWDFTDERVMAESSLLELEVDNTMNEYEDIELILYVLLKNEVV